MAPLVTTPFSCSRQHLAHDRLCLMPERQKSQATPPLVSTIFDILARVASRDFDTVCRQAWHDP